jgi:hypothetical protein
MDQKIIARGGLLTGVMLLVIGICVFPLAIGFLTSYPHQLWPLGLLLLASSMLMIAGSVKSLRSSSKKLKQTDEQMRLLKKTPAINLTKPQQHTGQDETVAPLSINSVLARWTYTEEEWKKFYAWELKDRKLSAVVTGLVVAVISSLLFKFYRETSWWVVIAICATISILYSMLSYHFAISSIGRAVKLPNTVVITGNAVLINDKLNPFTDEDRWMGEVKILEEPEPKVLEITYHWNTRKGSTSDEIHIPIPKGKLGEAVLLMDQLRKIREQ